MPPVWGRLLGHLLAPRASVSDQVPVQNLHMKSHLTRLFIFKETVHNFHLSGFERGLILKQTQMHLGNGYWNVSNSKPRDDDHRLLLETYKNQNTERCVIDVSTIDSFSWLRLYNIIFVKFYRKYLHITVTRFPIISKNEPIWAWALSSKGRKQAKLTTSAIVVTALVCD